MEQLEQYGATDRNSRYKGRFFAFTWNNYTISDMEHIKGYMANNYTYYFGEEIAPTTGTPHLQGCLEFKNEVSREKLRKEFPGMSIDFCKKSIWANRKYCGKDGKIHTNMIIKKSLEQEYNEFMQEEYKNIIWKPWQQKVIDILESKPDRRKIHWFWEEEGNTGKSFLARYIEWKYKCVIVNGKQSDVFNGIKTYIESKEQYPNVVIIDIPRVNENYVCYGTMEKIKDGLFYSGKYEGGTIRLLPLHLIVFTNFPPDTTKLSKDRWDIYKI